MSLHDLKFMVSAEDFADAHEPVNDGVREVPNAATIAADTKVTEVKDTSTAGPATTIAPKEDEPEAPSFDTVSESAETKTEVTETTTEPEETLEHDTEKATQEELEKVTKATTALESFGERAKRFDIIGYPKVQLEKVTKIVNYLNRKAGQAQAVTISAESIGAALQLGHTRAAKLERDLVKLQSKVSNESVAEEIAVTDTPTEHGAPPVDPVVAADAALVETDPLDVPITEIKRVEETIEVLTQAGCAVEQYIGILRSGKGISKQAAAVMHAGLEHIDQVCGLKVRATGMEGFDTTPRSAMEAADVSENGLLKRAGDIGARILRMLKELIAKAAEKWSQFSTGLIKFKDQVDNLGKANFEQKDLELNNPSSLLFLNGKFVGGEITPDERSLAMNMEKYYVNIAEKRVNLAAAALKYQDPDDIIPGLQSDIPPDSVFAKLPGDKWVSSIDGKLQLTAVDNDVPQSININGNNIYPTNLLRDISHRLAALDNVNISGVLTRATDKITKALVDYRKSKGADLDEAAFQKIQNALIDNTVKKIDLTEFFGIVKHLVGIYHARYKLCEQLVK